MRRCHAVKKIRFTEDQIAFALEQASWAHRCLRFGIKMGISDATFYNWRKNCSGLGELLVGHLLRV